MLLLVHRNGIIEFDLIPMLNLITINIKIDFSPLYCLHCLNFHSNIVYLSITQSRLLFLHKFDSPTPSHMAFDAMMTHRSPFHPNRLEVHKIVIDICEQQGERMKKGKKNCLFGENSFGAIQLFLFAFAMAVKSLKCS